MLKGGEGNVVSWEVWFCDAELKRYTLLRSTQEYPDCFVLQASGVTVNCRASIILLA
jgi:hypothetical protein